MDQSSSGIASLALQQLLTFHRHSKWFEGVEIIGVSSGASVPEILVTDLLKDLAKRGYSDVETVTAMEEHLLFSVPPELRKDLKAAGKL